MAHLKGIQLFLYLDDWLVQVANFFQGTEQGEYLVSLCQSLGLVLNFKKSGLVPSQDFTFIRAHFNLRDSMVQPTLERFWKG